MRIGQAKPATGISGAGPKSWVECGGRLYSNMARAASGIELPTPPTRARTPRLKGRAGSPWRRIGRQVRPDQPNEAHRREHERCVVDPRRCTRKDPRFSSARSAPSRAGEDSPTASGWPRRAGKAEAVGRARNGLTIRHAAAHEVIRGVRADNRSRAPANRPCDPQPVIPRLVVQGHLNRYQAARCDERHPNLQRADDPIARDHGVVTWIAAAQTRVFHNLHRAGSRSRGNAARDTPMLIKVACIRLIQDPVHPGRFPSSGDIKQVEPAVGMHGYPEDPVVQCLAVWRETGALQRRRTAFPHCQAANDAGPEGRPDQQRQRIVPGTLQ